MSTENAEQLLQKLAEQLEVPELSLDEDGFALISIDGYPVYLQYRDNRDDLLVSAPILQSETEGESHLDLYRELLRANFSGLSTESSFFSLDSSNNSVWLQKIVPLENLEAEQLQRAIDSHSLTALTYVESLGESVPAAEDGDSSEPAPEASTEDGSTVKDFL